MLPQVLGLALTRTIPRNLLFGVLTGAYQVCGGVIRNNSGQILAHLVNGVDPITPILPVNAVFGPINAGLGAINAYQLHRIGTDVTQIGAGVSELKPVMGAMSANLAEVKQAVGTVGENVAFLQTATNHLIALSTGTMLLSGLTLAVSTAGFAFLNKKLNKIDSKLQELQKDVKEIKAFLKMRQRAELTTALNTLRDVSDAPSDDTRRQLLVNSRQTLGVLHNHYKSQFEEAGSEGIVSASEEYFTITAIAHALCAGELNMHEAAARDLDDSYACWSDLCRKVAREKLLRSDPERFLRRRYAETVHTDELIDWMEFAHAVEKGIGWIDELRVKPSRDSWWNTALSHDELLDVELFRRLASRNRIFQGYCAQYKYFKQQKIRPSEFQLQIEKLDRSQMVEDTYVLIANELAGSEQAG